MAKLYMDKTHKTMNIIPYKRVKVTEGLYIKQSKHFFHTDFGVRDGGNGQYGGRRYICTGVPGTGFIERESESHSYHEFVRKQISQQKPSYLKLLLGKEPSYIKELDRARVALTNAEDPLQRRILDCYVNALGVGRTEERLERVVRGIKDKIGHKSNKFLVSVMSHYKSKISQLGHDMRSVELDVKDTCTPEQYEKYCAMVECFTKVAGCRRVWHLNESAREKYLQVHFDLGIFDFIRCDHFIPIMRDSRGVHYYLLPTHLIIARSTVDFDLVPLKDLTIVCQELAIEETVEVVSSRLGDAASMIRIPEYDLTWYFNHVRPIMHFVGAYDELRESL